MNLKLRKTHYEQLLSYASAVEEDGWYCGNIDQFRKRHEEIVTWLENQLNTDDPLKDSDQSLKPL